MTTEEQLSSAALNSWKLVVGRLDKAIAPLTDEQLQKQVAPGKNRLFYLVGHLTAVHDRMFSLLGLDDRLHPEFDEVYITNPDRALPDPVSSADLKRAWSEVNSKLTAALEKLTPQQWLEKHTAVSAEDFAKDPTRNRLAVLMSRTNHAAFHTGQAVLIK
jgi:DinB superfamily